MRQQEMRRRVWALVRMSDVMFSHQVSLPSMIYEHNCDTLLPSNIFDEEFGPDSKVLPPSRPNSEPTPISYMIVKVKLCQELGNILQATSRVKDLVHYDDILRLDARLRALRAELPPHLRIQPLEGSHDPLTLIIARFNIDILYLKVMCVLHRKYMPRARHNPRYAHSRRSAIEASVETLRHLITLHRESQANGRLRSIRWFVNSIATKDFVLPAMLVVLDLHHDISAERNGQGLQNSFFWTPNQRAEMIHNLEGAKEIWKGLADTSMEATKAWQILELMLEKINQAPQPTSKGIPEVAMKSDSFADMAIAPNLQPEHSAAMTLGMLSGGMSPNTAASFNSIQSPGGTSYPMDLGLGLMGGSGATQSMPADFTSLYPMSGLGVPGGNPGSPLSGLFGSLGGNDTGVMDFTGSNFDWVSPFSTSCTPCFSALHDVEPACATYSELPLTTVG